MTALDRVRWTLGLVVVLLLIFSTGRSNVDNSKRIQAAIETIYADRLVVKNIIYELRSLLYEKELAVARDEVGYFGTANDEANTRARELIVDFRRTYLVPLEESTLERFSTTFDALVASENEAGLVSGSSIDDERAGPFVERLDRLVADLDVLARIQLDEGRRQRILGEKAVESMGQMAAVKRYLLSALGILAMVIILFIPKRTGAS
jgi:hypothetical protein